MNRLRISLTIRFRDVFVDSLVSREFEITVDSPGRRRGASFKAVRERRRQERKEGRRRTLTGRGEKKGVNAERGATRPKDAKLPKKSTR